MSKPVSPSLLPVTIKDPVLDKPVRDTRCNFGSSLFGRVDLNLRNVALLASGVASIAGMCLTYGAGNLPLTAKFGVSAALSTCAFFAMKEDSDPARVNSDDQQYLAYINSQIGVLNDAFNSGKLNTAEYEAILTQLTSIETSLQKVFGQDYVTGNYVDFENQWSNPDGFKAQIAQAMNGITPTPPTPNAKEINQAYQSAQKLLASVLSDLQQDQSVYSTLASKIAQWTATIKQLAGAMGNNPTPKTLQDLKTAQTQLAAIQAQATKMQASLTTLTTAQTEISQLQALAQKTTPSDADVKTALAILATIQSQVNSPMFSQAQSDFDANTPAAAEISAMGTDIVNLQKDIGPVTVQGQTSYIDLGTMNGMSLQQMSAIIDQLKSAGVTQVDFAFGALTNSGSWTGGLSADAFKQLVDYIHTQGMKADLSIGGYNNSQSPANWDAGSTPQAAQALADQLAQFVKDHGLDAIDFDYELQETPPNPDNLLAFFERLHADLQPLNIPMNLTVMAGPSNSVGSPDGHGYGNGPITNLFENFAQCFDGLNLMMYGGPEYLTGNPNYLQMWIGDHGSGGVIQQFGIPMNAVQVGFMDYPGGANSGGYPGPGTDGENAGNDYLAALSALGYTPSEFGGTFWWPNEAQGYPQAIETVAQEIKDFEQVLNG